MTLGQTREGLAAPRDVLDAQRAFGDRHVDATARGDPIRAQAGVDREELLHRGVVTARDVA